MPLWHVEATCTADLSAREDSNVQHLAAIPAAYATPTHPQADHVPNHACARTLPQSVRMCIDVPMGCTPMESGRRCASGKPRFFRKVPTALYSASCSRKSSDNDVYQLSCKPLSHAQAMQQGERTSVHVRAQGVIHARTFPRHNRNTHQSTHQNHRVLRVVQRCDKLHDQLFDARALRVRCAKLSRCLLLLAPVVNDPGPCPLQQQQRGGGHMDTCMQFIPHNARKKKAEMQTQEDS